MKSRRDFIKNSSLVLGTAMLPWQKDFLNFLGRGEGKFQLLRKNVGIYSESGGTIAWLINKEGIAVVDSQFPEQAGNLIKKIKEKHDRQFDLLINTHHHRDHSGGNIAFKDIVDKVVAHENSKANQKRVAKEKKIVDTQLYPDTTFSESWSQKVGRETITARYYGRAHTDGDAVIHFENANIVHCGDLVFNRRFPYIDRSAGASIKNWIKVLDAIRENYDDEALFIFGHAFDPEKITGDKTDVLAMRNYLITLLNYVEKEKSAGSSLEDMLNANLKTIPGAPDWKGKGIERSIRSAYEELSE